MIITNAAQKLKFVTSEVALKYAEIESGTHKLAEFINLNELYIVSQSKLAASLERD